MIDFLAKQIKELTQQFEEKLTTLAPEDRVAVNRIVQQNQKIVNDNSLSFEQKIKQINEVTTEILKAHGSKGNE